MLTIILKNLKGLLYFFLSLILLLSSTSVHANKFEKVTLQLKWFHQFQFAGYYAAVEKGFYAEEGLGVVIRERDKAKGHIQSVVDGDADYGVADAGLMVARMGGAPVVLLKQIFQHSPLVLITLKDSDLTSPFELRDKRVMLKSGSHADALFKAMLIDSLGSLEHVKFVQHSFSNKELIAGQIDAMSVYLTDQPIALKQQGVEVNVIDPRDYGIDFYGDNLFTTEQEIRENPERVEKMTRASLKGWQYALEHPDEIIEVV